MNKDTIPAYPDIHGESKTIDGKKLAPAAFPSLPFKRRQGSAGNPLENRVTAETNPSSTHSRPLMSLRHQNGPLRRDPASPKNSKKATNAEDVEMTNEESLDQSAINDMQTSPILLPADPSDALEERRVCWDRIGITLQIYIFDNLLQQFVYPDIVAEVLGLDTSDLVKLAHVKNGRVLRAETTEELWTYCRSLGDGTKPFIDPQVLRRYMDYFTYVSRFEEASVMQRRTAVVFLRQRKIEGAFVEALLQDETGIWTWPDHKAKDPSHDPTNSTIFTYDGEADWGSILSRTPVHDSHDLDMVAPHFRSYYLPSVVRNNLLAKPLEDLNAFEKWLMYGSIPSFTTETESTGELLVVDPSRPGKIMDPVPRGLSTSLHRQIREGDRVSLEDSRKTTSKLYTITKTTHQSRLVREKIEQMPLSRQQKNHILKVAEEHAESMLINNLKTFPPRVSEHSRTVASTPASSSEQSEDSTQPSRSTNLGLHNSFSSDRATSSSPNVGQGYSSATSPEPEQANHHPVDEETTPAQRTEKSRSITLLTDATLMLKNQEPAYRAHKVPHENDAERSQHYDTSRHARALSQESYHTAPDHEDRDTEVSTTSRQLTMRSPSPPLWSPITDGDGEMQQVSSLSAQVSGQAATYPDLPLSKNPAFRRATPWKSAIASSRKSPTASRGHQVQQQNGGPISQPPLEILSGIHEAAASPTPSPMVPPNYRLLSTNPNRQPSPSKLPTPSLVPSLKQQISPSKPQKKKQRNTVDPTAPSLPQPHKAKVNLKLRMPGMIAADSSTSGDSPPTSPNKKIRSDKGKKRGPYMTKKTKLAIEAKAVAEAKAETQPQAEVVTEAQTEADQKIKSVVQEESNENSQANGPSEPLTKETEGTMEKP